MSSGSLSRVVDRQEPSVGTRHEVQEITLLVERGALHEAPVRLTNILRDNLAVLLALEGTDAPGAVFVVASALAQLDQDTVPAIAIAIKRTRVRALGIAFGAEVGGDVIAAYLAFHAADMLLSDRDTTRAIARTGVRLFTFLEKSDTSAVPDGLIAALGVINPDLLALPIVREKFLANRSGYALSAIEQAARSGKTHNAVFALLATYHAQRGEHGLSATLWARHLGALTNDGLAKLPEEQRTILGTVLTELSRSVVDAIERSDWRRAFLDLVPLRRLFPAQAAELDNTLADGMRNAIATAMLTNAARKEFFELYMQLRPQDESIKHLFAKLLIREKDFAQAYGILRETREAPNQDAAALLGLARSAIQVGRVMEAVAAGRRAAALDPKIGARFATGETSITECMAALGWSS